MRIDTDLDPSRTSEAILENAGATDLVVPKGGEGTVLIVAESLLQLPKEQRPDFLQAPAGTANDSFRGLNGNVHGRQALSQVVRMGERVEIQPLNLTVHRSGDDSVQTHIGLNNAGLNFSADMAAWLNSRIHRQGRLQNVPLLGRRAQEALTSIRATRDLSRFELYEPGSDEALYILDMSLMIGRIAAKYGRPGVRHTESDFFEMKTVASTRSAVIVGMARLSLGRADGVRRTAMSFTTGKEPTLAHVDGEIFVIDPGSEISITRSSDTLTTYSLLAARKSRS